MNQVTPEVTPQVNLTQVNTDIKLPEQPNQIVVSSPSEPEPETEKDINWKKFKAERQKDRELKDEYAKRAAEKEAEASALKAAMEAILNKQSTNSVRHGNTYENDNEETEEQRIDRKVNELLTKKEAEYERRRLEKEQQEYPQRLVQTHSDFNQVCNAENIDYLEYHYPEVAAAFKHMPDNYEKWSTVYKAVKRFVPNTDTRKDTAKMEKNLSKPQSMSSTGTSQSGNITPIRLDEARKKANWERMERTRKGLS